MERAELLNHLSPEKLPRFRRDHRLPYNIFADINGDGVVTLADVTLIRALIGNHL